MNDATNDLKLYDTIPEILHDSVQLDSTPN